jgi:alkanesulfonate monooxygenase SsuD/methylene tetrahydromethanopterin reductase-like flavin-dependent oxidoreductase (luciferase family)
MTGCLFGRNTAEVEYQAQAWELPPSELRQRGLAVGTANEIVDQLGQWSEAGVQRIMLQWLDQDGLDRLEAMAHAILPQLT